MTIDMARLRKLLGVAMSSDQPGECAAAMAKARKLLADEKLDIHWVLDRIDKPGQAQTVYVYQQAKPAASQPNDEWEDMLEECSTAVGTTPMREKDEEFILSLANQRRVRKRYGWEPSEKQLSWLAAIYARYVS